MDASDWFEDSPVPPDLRAQVDTVLKPRFDALADQMKDSLNLWTGDGLDLEQTQLYQTISAFAGAMSTVAEGFEAYAEVMQTLVHATTRIGVGFVPVVGPALDLCEAVTGKAWCLPSGRGAQHRGADLLGGGVRARGGRAAPRPVRTPPGTKSTHTPTRRRRPQATSRRSVPHHPPPPARTLAERRVVASPAPARGRAGHPSSRRP